MKFRIILEVTIQPMEETGGEKDEHSPGEQGEREIYIHSLPLSGQIATRIFATMDCLGIKTVSQLFDKFISPRDILRVRNFGYKCLDALHSALSEAEVSLPPSWEKKIKAPPSIQKLLQSE